MLHLLYDTHLHTPLCKHATGSPQEYAKQAESSGLKGIIFTCHSPMPGGFAADTRMSIDEFDVYVDLIEATRKHCAKRVDVRLGLESDWFPGMEEWLAKLHSRASFNYILGSVHPHLDEYKQAFFKNDVLSFQRTYFQHLAEAAESGLFDCISHPDLVKNCYPTEWKPDLIIGDIRHTLDRIKRTGIAMEINTSGLCKKIREMNPAPFMLREMRQRNIPIVIGSDAHVPTRVGAGFLSAAKLLLEAGYSEVNYFLERKRITVPIDTAFVCTQQI